MKLLRLVDARPAEGEEVIGADSKARRARLAQIEGKGIVDMVAAFCRLDDGEGDIVGGNTPPVDQPLMMGNVDAPDRIPAAVRRKRAEVEKAARHDEACEDQSCRAREDNPFLQKRAPSLPTLLQQPALLARPVALLFGLALVVQFLAAPDSEQAAWRGPDR